MFWAGHGTGRYSRGWEHSAQAVGSSSVSGQEWVLECPVQGGLGGQAGPLDGQLGEP